MPVLYKLWVNAEINELVIADELGFMLFMLFT